MLEDAGRIAAARHQFPKYTRTSAPEGAKTPMFSIDEAREHEREGPCDAGRGSKREREEPRVSDAGASANASRATSDASASATR